MNAPLRPLSVAVRPTGAGRALIAVTILALLGAWAGGGVAFAVIAMFAGALCLVGALATWRHASGLRIDAPPPVTAFSGERFVLDVPVANLARSAAAFDVLFWLESVADGHERIGALVPRIAAGEETRVEVVHPVLRRGVHPQGRLELSSAFPLGLWVCRIRFELPDRILVLPRLGTLRRIDRRSTRLRAETGQGGAGRGDEQEVYGIRAWRDGEGMRSVHWKLSARRGRLLVREFRSEPRPPVHVILATALNEGTRTTRNAFEDAVTLAATLVEDQVRNGHVVRLTLLGRDAQTVVCSRGRGAIFPVLRALAEVQPELRADVQRLPARPPRSRRGEKTYVVRVAPDPKAPRGLAAVPDGSVTVFDVTDDGVTSVFDKKRRPGRELLLGVRR